MTLDLLFPHFDTLIRTPEDVARLNEAILALAVRGQLVPQDPADEPANELLKRIRAEKRRLVKEGKLKEEDQLPRIAESELPFDLPDTWVWSRLGEVTEYAASGANGLQAVTDDTWVLDLEDIEKTTSRLLQRVRVRDRAFKSSKNFFKMGDVLYGKLRPYLDKVIVADEDGLCTTEIVPIRVYLDIEPQYLRLALKRPDFLAYVSGKTYGVKMPRLGTKDARMALFPLPPLAEQRRIVAKVESLFAQTRALEAKLRQAQADIVTVNRAALHRLGVAADGDAFAAAWVAVRDAFDLLYDDPRNVAELRQAILQLAVQGQLVPQDPADEPASELLKRIRAEKRRLAEAGELVRTKAARPVKPEDELFGAPSSWIWARVSHIGDVRLGRQRSPDHHFGDHMRSYIRSANVTWQGLDLTDVKQMDFPPGVFEAYRLEKDDILLNEASGSPGEVGKTVIWKNEIPDCCFQNTLIRVRLFGFWPDYVKLYFVWCARTGHFGRSSQGIGINHLGADRLAEIPIAVAPLPEQRRIVAKVESLFAQTRVLEAKLRQAEELRRALVAAVLGGAAA